MFCCSSTTRFHQIFLTKKNFNRVQCTINYKIVLRRCDMALKYYSQHFILLRCQNVLQNFAFFLFLHFIEYTVRSACYEHMINAKTLRSIHFTFYVDLNGNISKLYFRLLPQIPFYLTWLNAMEKIEKRTLNTFHRIASIFSGGISCSSFIIEL